jgi:DNA-binding NarL/FixJ family response regulator
VALIAYGQESKTPAGGGAPLDESHRARSSRSDPTRLSLPRWHPSRFRRGDPITIALADDQHLVRQGIRCLLELEKDFKIVGDTGDGIKVVGLVARLEPSVLIVALAMPGLNGVEITRQVRQRFPQTGVVVLSMSTDDRYVIEALRSGAGGYLVKQAKASELIRAIRRVAGGRYYLSAPFRKDPVEVWLQRCRRATPDPYTTLTSREREVLQLVAEGHSSGDIAGRLAISRRTAEAHRANFMRKLRLHNHVELIQYALGRGILMLPGDPLRPADPLSAPGPAAT